jgi:hypothetical protein
MYDHLKHTTVVSMRKRYHLRKSNSFHVTSGYSQRLIMMSLMICYLYVTYKQSTSRNGSYRGLDPYGTVSVQNVVGHAQSTTSFGQRLVPFSHGNGCTTITFINNLFTF